MNMSRSDTPATASFGRFLLDFHRRELLADGVSVPIGGRAFDVLVTLVEAQGQLVTKGDLLSRVWPQMTVEENTLQFQISALRKALGADRDFIKTICGRGYRFVAHVSLASHRGSASVMQRVDAQASAGLSDGSAPAALLAELAYLIAADRLAALDMLLHGLVPVGDSRSAA
jgi:DNA-binding winged helix-turn-helix (wHTH) protein